MDNGAFDFGVEGYGGGTVYPVVYTNQGESTFLEIGPDGVPIEPYVVGPAITINAPPPPDGPVFDNLDPQNVDVGGTYDYTISGLNDDYYYRITLVVGDNVTPNGNGGRTFIDSGMGTAAAGPSEEVALISAVGGALNDPGTKTVPDPGDDPAAPSGVAPVNGSITVTVEGVGSGTIYPVAYRNTGASTFLEIDGAGSPIEDYAVGGSFTVATP